MSFKSLISAFFLIVAFAAPAVADFSLNRGISGSWYNPDQDGHGFAMEYLDDSSLLVYWYMYTPQGDSAFVLGVGTIQGNQVTIPMRYADGMVFGEFDPATLTRPFWGTVIITFDSCTSGTVSYESDFSVDGLEFGDGVFPIARLAYIQDLACDVAELGRDLPQNPITGFFEGSIDNFVDAVGVIFEDGKTWIITPDAELLIGTLTHDNGVATGSLTVKSDVDGVLGTVDVVASFSARDWVRGSYTGLGGGSFSLAYRTSYERDSSLDGYAGRYSFTDIDAYSVTFDVDAAGAITGFDTDGCSFAGQISLLDSRFNPAALNLEISGCPEVAGVYEGVVALADLVDAGDSRLLYAVGENDARAVVGALIKEP